MAGAAATEVVRLQPSTTAIATATGILAGIGGYLIGQARSLGLIDRPSYYGSRGHGHQGQSSGSSSSSDDDGELAGLGDFPEHRKEEHKLVLVVRTDLGMSRGKMAAQCSHATLACYKTLLRTPSAKATLKQWERHGQAKVVVQAKTEDELETLQALAVSKGLCARLIRDAGRTQIVAGSATVLGVGPGPKTVVDSITGALKLL